MDSESEEPRLLHKASGCGNNYGGRIARFANDVRLKDYRGTELAGFGSDARIKVDNVEVPAPDLHLLAGVTGNRGGE